MTMVVVESSNINEGIGVIFFFFAERFHTHKNAHKRTKAKKAVLNALKKHLRGRMSLIRLFASLFF